MGEDIRIPTKTGESFAAYLAVPAQTPAPAIIVIQEIFGVNADVRAKCDEYAAQGYLAIAPDLFWRLEPDVQLTDKTEEEWKKAFDLLNRFDLDEGVNDIRATHHTIKGHAHCTGKVGVVGFCLGGRLAYMTAARSSVECAVGYYGIKLETMLDEADHFIHPVLLHIAEEDEYVPPAAQEEIRDALKDNPHVTIYSYPGMKHAFTRKDGQHFDAKNAALANGRTMAFFEKNLK